MSERVKFAVVREDPDLEAELVTLTGARAALVVASGGCTALSLAARFPALRVTAFDRSAGQLAHVRAKLALALAGDLAALNVESADPGALNQRGEFEGLFRQLRLFLEELAVSPGELDAFFAGNGDRALVERWTASRYWKVAFELFFHDALLTAMFGPDATQHAAPGSYPAYFRGVFERGLARKDAARNPFLQHVLLGRYRAADAPAYASLARDPDLELVQGSLEDVPALERFQVVSLSNIFDWSGDELASSWARLLATRARPGTAVLIRQLNNRRDVARFFAPAFRVDEPISARLLAQDRSLFYERVLVLFRRDA
jgi:S-adenosylmethionine-diacylglycerol 3-amino-3-carboxypropyl transferase